MQDLAGLIPEASAARIALPAASTLRAWLEALQDWHWLAAPLAVVVASRAAVLMIAWVGVYVLPQDPSLNTMFRGPAYSARPFLGLWYAWDASWYAAIALNGYQASGPEAPGLAFWPLLPLLEALVSRLALLIFPPVSPGAAVMWAGLLVVFCAFLGGAALVYRLVAADHGPDVARRATTFLAFAPGAFYYTAPYPEALLLAGVAGCLLALRHQRWLLAGLAGMAAAVAHVPGCLLALPFAWEYLLRRRGRIGPSVLWLLLIPLGPGLWLLYLWTLTGDFLAPVTAARAFWTHRPAWPWETVAHAIPLAFRQPYPDVQVLLNLVATLLAAGAAVWALRAGHASWGLWTVALLALYLSLPAYEPLDGMLRYSLAALPIWLLLARMARHPALEAGILGLLTTLLGLLTAMFIRGYWIA